MAFLAGSRDSLPLPALAASTAFLQCNSEAEADMKIEIKPFAPKLQQVPKSDLQALWFTIEVLPVDNPFRAYNRNSFQHEIETEHSTISQDITRDHFRLQPGIAIHRRFSH